MTMEVSKIAKLKDLTGLQFGKLTVIKRAKNKGRRVMWLCFCSCGHSCIVQSNHLCEGVTTSCGHCADARNSRLYKSVWNKMFQRCNNPNNKDYKNYGARGISICDEWKDFVTFRNWALQNGYDEFAKYGECTLDRINVNGDYCPENCRFTGSTIQCRNKRNNHLVAYQGETKTIAERADVTGISVNALYNRINRGWDLDRAFHQPVRQRRDVI